MQLPFKDFLTFASWSVLAYGWVNRWSPQQQYIGLPWKGLTHEIQKYTDSNRQKSQPPHFQLFKYYSTFHQRRRWHPTPVLLPGKSHGWRSLVGCSPWGRWVGHDWVTSLSLFTLMHWRRKWQPTPVFLPGESQGRGILVGCRLWGHTESGTPAAT